MSREFSSGSDAITFSPGGLAGSSRAVTVVTLMRPVDPTFNSLSSNTDLVVGRASASVRWAQFVSSQHHYGDGDFGGGPTALADKDTWYRLVTRRASGGSVAYRHGVAALGGAWAWSNGSAVGDGSGAVDNALVGGNPVIGNAKMAVAAIAVYDGDPFGSDGAAEAAITADMADWMAADPLWAVQFNQASTGDAVTDLTGGGGDQSAISGTAVGADPGGWTYFAGDVTGQITAQLGGLTATLAGSRSKTALVVASLGGLVATIAGARAKTGAATATLGALHAVLAGDGEDVTPAVGVLTPGTGSAGSLTAGAASVSSLLAG